MNMWEFDDIINREKRFQGLQVQLQHVLKTPLGRSPFRGKIDPIFSVKYSKRDPHAFQKINNLVRQLKMSHREQKSLTEKKRKLFRKPSLPSQAIVSGYI